MGTFFDMAGTPALCKAVRSAWIGRSVPDTGFNVPNINFPPCFLWLEACVWETTVCIPDGTANSVCQGRTGKYNEAGR